MGTTVISAADQLKLSTLWREAHTWVHKSNSIRDPIARLIAKAHARTLLDEYFGAIETTLDK